MATIMIAGGSMLVEGVCLTVGLQRDLAKCGEPEWPLEARWVDDFEYREYMSRIGMTLPPAHERIAAGEQPTWRFVIERVGFRFCTSAVSPLSDGEIARIQEVLA